MILLPIGHEETGVRRLPWITFGLMAVCCVAFILSGRGQILSSDDIQLSKEVMAAVDYYVEHPYLELKPRFEERVFDGNEEQALSLVAEAYDGLAPPSNGAIRASQQEALDDLMARVVGSFDSHPLFRWGLVPNEIKPWSLITHMFMHAGWLHLLGNLLILYLAGPFIEDVWGRPLYLGFYVGAGLFAALAYIAFNAGSAVPMIGASGAIAGVMGAFLVRYRQTRIRFFYMVGIFFRGTFSAPALLMLPMWFGEQLFFAMLAGNSDGGAGVAYWAHIGGFAFGAGTALAMRAWQIEERHIDHRIEGKVSDTVLRNHAVEQALQAQTRGQAPRAFEILTRELRRSPSNRDAALAYWSLAIELQRERDAAPLLARAIWEALRSGEAEVALQHWWELCERVPHPDVEPSLLVRLAQALADQNRQDEARIAVRRAMLAAGSGPPTALAFKIAQVARELDPAIARAALQLVSQRTDLDPHEKRMVHKLSQEIERRPTIEPDAMERAGVITIVLSKSGAPQPLPVADDRTRNQ